MEAHAMYSITQDDHSTKCISEKSNRFFQQYQIGKILKASNGNKMQGFSAIQILRLLFTMVFCHRSLFMQMNLHPASVPFGKDTVYRFLNSCHTNWRRFVLLLLGRIIRDTIEPLTDKKRKNVLILDDSIFSRSRSKKVELLAKLYDHANHVYTFGFRMLTLGWTDGNSFLPVNHCLLSTENPKYRVNEAYPTTDLRTNGGKQKAMAQQKMTDIALHLLKEAKAERIPAHYVLFDSWFCSPSFLISVKHLKYDVIAMVRKTTSQQYRHQGKWMNVKTIYERGTKRRGKAKILLSVEAEAVKDGIIVPVRFVYVRNRAKRNDYLVLVTTDMKLSEEEIVRLYGKRWSIEMFFKMCKSYLRLSKECRSVSYDAMVAHVAIVFARYMLLAVEQRENRDMRSLGELFYLSVDELPDIQYMDALRLILARFAELIQKKTVLEENEVLKLLDAFIEELPSLWKYSLRICA